MLRLIDAKKVIASRWMNRRAPCATQILFMMNRRIALIAPGGQRLLLKSQVKAGDRRFYQGKADVCGRCRYYDRCCQSRKGEARTITTDRHEGLRRHMRERMAQADAKSIYKRRKVIVEPVFGHIKNGGFRRFSVRGKQKVAGEFSLVCAAHNVKKMVRAIMIELVCPEFGNTSIQWE